MSVSTVVNVDVNVSVSMDVDALHVWQVLSDFNNITEAQARNICSDFTSVGIELPADALAIEYAETIQEVCESMESPDIREAILSGSDDLLLSTNADDPFYGSAKIQQDDLNKYLIYRKGEYQCNICYATHNDYVQLSCNLNAKPCRGMFCETCIGPWVTTCVARCPVCREFCKEIRNVPVRVAQKTAPAQDNRKKVVISLRRGGNN